MNPRLTALSPKLPSPGWRNQNERELKSRGWLSPPSHLSRHGQSCLELSKRPGSQKCVRERGTFAKNKLSSQLSSEVAYLGKGLHWRKRLGRWIWLRRSISCLGGGITFCTAFCKVRRRFTQLLKPAVGGIHRLEVLENLLLAVEVDTQIHLAGPE